MNPRIISGKYKNTKLETPDCARPITDKAKTAVFSILISKIKGSNVLDLFAGSGSFGFECISRGANHVTLIDNDEQAINTLTKTVKKLGLDDKTEIIQLNAYNINNFQNNLKFDLIFIDPPYESSRKFECDTLNRIIQPDGLIIFKHYPKYIFPQLNKFKIVDQRTYGKNSITFLSRI